MKFEGVFSEKILSLLADEGIGVWKLKYKNGNIYARIYAKDFKKLRKIRRGIRIKIKITEKHGFPFFVKKYKHRSGLIAGAVIFFAILKFLSGFIWIINVEGGNTVNPADILVTLKEIGIYETVNKDDVNAKLAAQRLLIERDDLAWASLNIEGSVLNVNVTEIKNSVKKDTDIPSNLIASSDGIVRKIDAVSGDVRVKVGDNVHKGDVLISGIIESMSSTVFVHSAGAVTAQVEKIYSSRDDFIQKVKVFNGHVNKNNVIEILGVKIPLFLAYKQAQADTSYKLSQLKILGNNVPVRFFSAQKRHYTVKKLVFGEDELKTQLSKRLKDFIETESIEGYIPIRTDYTTDYEGVQIFHHYLCDENIAVGNKILVSQ